MKQTNDYSAPLLRGALALAVSAVFVALGFGLAAGIFVGLLRLFQIM